MTVVAGREEDEDRTPQREDFMRALTWLLDERGMSMRELAGRLGRSSHTTFYRWQELKAEPPPREVFAIERVLEVPPGTLSIRLGYLPPDARRPAPAGASLDDFLRSDPELNDLARRTIRAVYNEVTRRPSKRPAK